AGKQGHAPLLAGWNSEESNARGVLGRDEPTKENFEKAVARLYGAESKSVLAEYAPASDAEVLQAATDLASDRFIAYSTWKWIDLHRRTSGKPVYRYFYTHLRPPGSAPEAAAGEAKGGAAAAPPPSRGAAHSAEIEYAMGNLP